MTDTAFQRESIFILICLKKLNLPLLSVCCVSKHGVTV